MPLVFLVLVLLIPLAMVAAVPLSFVLRYRASTARRMARGWVAALNVFAFILSATLFLTAAALTNLRVPHAFPYALAGFAGGLVLGVIGLWVSRWETTARGLHYTPSRALILALMLVIMGRMLYGVWRLWHAWHHAAGDQSWLASSGVAGSLGAGAVVLGYFLAYNAGVWRRFRSHRSLRQPR